jgi:hypothetical protein
MSNHSSHDRFDEKVYPTFGKYYYHQLLRTAEAHAS